MKAAILSEIEGLMKRGALEIVLREEVPDNCIVLGERVIISIKDPNTKEERYKASFVMQGHLDKDKPYLVHTSPNLRQEAVRMLFAITSLMGFELWTQYISQPYLQGSSEVMHEVFMDPKSKEFRLQPGQLLKPMKPLYGLSDSGDRWHHTLKEHFLMPTTGDLSLYPKHIGKRLIGLSGVYVDDLIETGSPELKRFAENTSR